MVNQNNIAVGVDWYKISEKSKGWVFVRLVDSAFYGAAIYDHFDDGVCEFADNDAVIGVDIPIGFPASPAVTRAADVEARRMVGLRHSSVFGALHPRLLEAGNYDDANRLSKCLFGKGLSKQSFSMRDMINEVQVVAVKDNRVYEVHPEVSFRALAGYPRGHSLAPKKSWQGHTQRRILLAGNQIDIPDDLGDAGTAGAADILDAAAAAWSANRIALGAAASLPNPPEHDANNRQVAIWY